MKYENIFWGTFVERPNRFIAKVIINGKEEVCHVKNTGRCRELLVKDAQVLVCASDNPNRKTKYDLIAVKKGDRIINIDSQAPNCVAFDFLRDYFGTHARIYREKSFGRSRFDFYIEVDERKIFLEVKGVTLEENGVVMFPDAPTERGVKHINELTECISHGYEAFVFFVIQMRNVAYFTTNDKTHREFGEAMRRAKEKGVQILAYDCDVTADTLSINSSVDVRL